MGVNGETDQYQINIRSLVLTGYMCNNIFIIRRKVCFPFRKIMPAHLKEKCRSQDWPGLKVIGDIKEERGVFVTKTFFKMLSFVIMVVNL